MKLALGNLIMASLLIILISGEELNAENKLLIGYGDSITAGFCAKRFGDNREYSWVTGKKLKNSILNQLIESDTNTYKAVNMATVGARISTVYNQVLRTKHLKPSIITLLIGANDLCQHLGDFDQYRSHFKNTYKKTLSTLSQSNPNAKIFVSKIPSLINLYNIASQSSACRKKWDYMPGCKPLLRYSNEEQRKIFHSNWIDLMALEKQIAEEIENPNLYFLDVEAGEFSIEDISKHDCFHPSVIGQELLANRVWSEIIAIGALNP